MEFRYVGLAALEAKAMVALVAGVNVAAEHFVGVAQAETPVDEGTLRASITSDGARVSGRSARAKVHTGGEANEYALYVHEGTAPHLIVASGARALAWPGMAHPVRAVHHPGTRAYKYLETPLLHYGPVYREFIARSARAAFS